MKIFILMVWLLIVAEVVLPAFAWHFPSATGYIEGFTHKYLAWGRCRIDNTKEALGTKGSRIMLGYVLDEMGQLRPHLWAEAGGMMVMDRTFPPDNWRQLFAVVDPKSMKVELDMTKSESEKLLLQWSRDYLPAFAKAHKISGA